jgi:hypothetical protein
MEFRKVSVPSSPEDPKAQIEGYDIPIKESVEKWSEIHLEDGTIFRAKISIANVVRLIDRFDDHGNPVYFINATPTVAMVQFGDSTTRKG